MRVVYSPLEYPNGSMSERWVCAKCGNVFAREHWLKELRARLAATEQTLGEKAIEMAQLNWRIAAAERVCEAFDLVIQSGGTQGYRSGKAALDAWRKLASPQGTDGKGRRM